jgi:hypothetical protein
MKKIITLLPIIAVLAACGTTDVYQKRVDNQYEREGKAIEQALKGRPDWMGKLPVSDSAVFAAAEGSAENYNMAVHLARTNALAEICYSAGGTVSSQTKQYDTGSTKSSNIEKVTRSNCNTVDVTGVETYGAKNIDQNPVVVRAGNRYTAYVLIALPTGDANVLRRAKEKNSREILEAQRSTQAFKELDKPQ